MVLYESHSVIHGRPFPLKGRFMANVFIHFYPEPEENETMINEAGEIELPIYLLEGSLEAEKWRNSLETLVEAQEENGYSRAHRAADTGDMKMLKYILKKNPSALHVGDVNGWQPLHFGIRSGYLEAVQFLVEHGADINYITNEGSGYSAMEVAEMYLPLDDPVISYLKTLQGENSVDASSGRFDETGSDEL
jgi:prolyl 4-hydroxylase